MPTPSSRLPSARSARAEAPNVAPHALGAVVVQALDVLGAEGASEVARVGALESLRGMRGDEVRLALLRALDDGSAQVREAAVQAVFAARRRDLHDVRSRPEALATLHFAALTHRRRDVREAALGLVPEGYHGAIAHPVLRAIAAGEVVGEAAEGCLARMAHLEIEEVVALFVLGAEAEPERAQWAAAQVAWELHYGWPRWPGSRPQRFAEYPPSPPECGHLLVAVDALHSPETRPLWHAWLDALRAAHPAAEAGLDRIALVLLALPTNAVSAHLSRDLLQVLQERVLSIGPWPAGELEMRASVLAVLALREPAVLILPTLPIELRRAALRELRGFYPEGPVAQRIRDPRAEEYTLRKLQGSMADMVRYVFRSAGGRLPAEPEELLEARAKGLPFGPAGLPIAPEDVEGWLAPDGPEEGGATMLEGWLELLAPDQRGVLVWNATPDATLLELLRRPQVSSLVAELLEAGGAVARRLLSLRERAEAGREGPAPLSAAGLRALLRCGHRNDIRARIAASTDLPALVALLPEMEALELHRRRRPYVEFAGQRIAEQLLQADDDALLCPLARSLDPAEETWGVLFYTLEAVARTRPRWLARIFVDDVLLQVEAPAERAATWARVDTFGQRFHSAVIGKLSGDVLARYLEVREVSVSHVLQPLTLAEALHRLATGRPLEMRRVRQGVASWITPALLQQAIPAPPEAERRASLRGLALAVVAALRDRVAGNHRALPTAGAAGFRLRCDADRLLNTLVFGEDDVRSPAELAEAGRTLQSAARWAAELGRRLGRGRRVQLLACVGGATVGAACGGGVSRFLPLLQAAAGASEEPVVQPKRRVPASVRRRLRRQRRRQRRVVGPRGRRQRVLVDALAALPMVVLLGAARQPSAEALALAADPEVARGLLCEVSRGVLPGSVREQEGLLERFATCLPEPLRGAASACVSPELFWDWATAPSDRERERLLAHLRVAPMARRAALTRAFPWHAAELPEAAVLNALLGGSAGERALLEEVESRLRSVADEMTWGDRPFPRLAACAALIAALDVPLVRRRRWLLHLFGTDTALLVCTLQSPGCALVPAGLSSVEAWCEERWAFMGRLPALLALSEGRVHRVVTDVLWRYGSWEEWSARVEAWKERGRELCRPGLIRVRQRARSVLIHSRGAASQAGGLGRWRNATNQHQRNHIGALRVLRAAVRSVAPEGEGALRADFDLQLAGLLIGDGWCEPAEARALLAEVLGSAPQQSFERILRMLGATLAPALREPAVQEAIVARAARCADDVLRERVRGLARSVPDVAFQRQVARVLTPIEERMVALRRLAELTRWTAELGRRLVGVPTRIRFIGGDTLGYTYLKGDTIWVNPAAWFEGAADGRAIVEGLIAHEIGHLALHAEPEMQAHTSEQAVEGRRHWMNIVMDEHLERNLRARDSALGDRFHKLGAWALDRRAQRVSAEEVFRRCGLRGLRGGVAARHLDALPWALHLQARELPAPRDPAARFFRSLRLGLGARDGDPVVQQGLGLFRGRPFREASAWELAWRAERLASLFPGDPGRSMDKVSTGCATADDGPTPDDPRDAMELGGWTVVEIEEAAAGPTLADGQEPGGGPSVVLHNRMPELRVHPFSQVVQPPVAHRAEGELRARARGLAPPVRAALAQLGQRRVQERHRPRGRRLDPAGLGRRVLSGDPRVLRRNRSDAQGDLFIGILVDSSGSMRMNANIDKAVLFAAITAVASKDLSHVTTRVAGFTHDTLLDLGDARHTRLSALVAEGGNNDAAALDWMGEQAQRSGRRHTLLLMVSDGRPTTSSEAALMARIAHWERSGMVLVQLALRDIDPPVFPRQVRLVGAPLRQTAQDYCRLLVSLVRSFSPSL